ncbi:hypothetical protein D9757_002942 [Collybiopsis confluens]|uniref:CRIB domain-containing protein n=1 Tax=Collybiopsis confluens TaxID=2823264 RepID=A0A8H5HVR4_9AGAR|nr:hypothetical protein D9757_002942 [Collybiopsis confluens]
MSSMPEQWSKLLTKSAITREDYAKDSQAVLDVLEFYTDGLKKREMEGMTISGSAWVSAQECLRHPTTTLQASRPASTSADRSTYSASCSFFGSRYWKWSWRAWEGPRDLMPPSSVLPSGQDSLHSADVREQERREREREEMDRRDREQQQQQQQREQEH